MRRNTPRTSSPMSSPCPVESRFRRLRLALARRWFWLVIFSVAALFLAGQKAVWGVAMPDSGSILSWGANSEGHFGNGQSEGRAVPASIQRISVGLSSKTIKLLAVGPSHSVAVADDNTIFAWGSNSEGQLGTGDLDNRLLPAAVNDLNSVLAGKVIVEVAAALSYTMVRTQDNRVFGWGRNDYGQLGTGVFNARSTVPVATLMGGMAGKTLTRIACGGGHTCGECLREHLATHVSIQHSAKKGKIEIEYYGNDDLARLLELMGLRSID